MVFIIWQYRTEQIHAFGYFWEGKLRLLFTSHFKLTLRATGFCFVNLKICIFKTSQRLSKASSNNAVQF